MTSDDLTKSLAKIIYDALFPGANYLVRLRERLEKAGFPSNDKLCELACKAHDAMRCVTFAQRFTTCRMTALADLIGPTNPTIALRVLSSPAGIGTFHSRRA